MFKLILSGQPVAKGRVRFARSTGRAFTPEKTVAYETRLALAAQEKMNGTPPFEGPLRVNIWAELQVPASWSQKKQRAAIEGRLRPTGRPDLDNYAKILDALNLIVWVDDGQVVDLYARKQYSTQPKLVIEVDRLDDFLA
jgi:Holliday junction resolvase RusA-like endonuclease